MTTAEDILTPQERILASQIDGAWNRMGGSGVRYYDRDGNEMSFGTWVMVFEHHPEYKQVAKTEVGDVTISTVWMGLDFAMPDEPRQFFETMVFGGSIHEEAMRYGSELDAIRGHKRMVELVRLDQELDPG